MSGELIQTLFQLGQSWVAWTIKENSLILIEQFTLSSVHIRFGDQAFNLFADDSVEPVIFGKMLCIMCPNQIFVLHFYFSVQASNLPNVLSEVSIEDNAACIVVCFIITDKTDCPHKLCPLPVKMVLCLDELQWLLELCIPLL